MAALVYSQEISQTAIMSYSQREQSMAINTNTAECTVQPLCYQPLCTSATEYLQPAPSSITAVSHDPTSTEPPLLNYSVSVCPLYRPSMSDPGLGNDSMHLQQPPPSDEVCFMMDPSASGDCSTIQGGPQPQSLNWQAYMVDKWYSMRDHALQDITCDEVTCGFAVEADKGFNYSQWDESFVCQKKNHFQISVQLKLSKVPKYLKTCATGREMELINCFGLHLYGMKFEVPDSVIPIEQSRTDRSKLSYEALLIDLPTFPDQLVKASACRLHFSETTANNMRKRGKPNPDQRYFSLVVALHAYTSTGNYPVVAYVSERIIVRASNPGQFDNEGDSTWLKGVNPNGGDIVFYQGKVGINTETPDEALTVVGNVQVTGQILQPSDARLKTDITEINTTQMLENVEHIKLYSYCFKPDAFGPRMEEESGRVPNVQITKEIGVLAQDVEKIIPDAVKKMYIKDKNGTVLVVNKDRLLMECIGAIQELGKQRTKRYHLIVVVLILLACVLCVTIVVTLFHFV